MGENGKGLSTGFIPYTEIPAPLEKVVAGDKTWDWTPQTEFFYVKQQEVLAKFQNVPTDTNEQLEKKTPTATPQQAFEPADSTNREVHDELPF